MSVKDKKILNHEPMTRWTEETISGYSVDVDISDADVSDLEVEYDLTGVDCRAKPISDIWEPDVLWLNLQVGVHQLSIYCLFKNV